MKQFESYNDGQCEKCGKPYAKGAQVYGFKPEGGKWKFCEDETCIKELFKANNPKPAGPKPSNQYAASKLSLSDALHYYNKAEEMLALFKARREPPTVSTLTTAPQVASTSQFVGLTESQVPISIEQELIFIESVFRTLSQGYKPDA